MRSRSTVWSRTGTGYKYNPEIEGYGNPDKWKAAFNQRMGLDAAREAVGKKSLLAILFGEELPVGWSARTASDQWAEIKKAYRKLAVKFYPEEREIKDATGKTIGKETHGDHEKFLEVQGAFEILEDQYRRKGVRV